MIKKSKIRNVLLNQKKETSLVCASRDQIDVDGVSGEGVIEFVADEIADIKGIDDGDFVL